MLVMGWLTVNRAYTSNQADGIAISDEETERVLPFLGCEVMCPEVETACCGHCGCYIGLMVISSVNLGLEMEYSIPLPS